MPLRSRKITLVLGISSICYSFVAVIMIKHYDSPLEKAIKQQNYQQHLKRIDHILKKHKTQPDTYQQPLKPSLPSKRHRYHQLDQNNLKLSKKLQEIRERKCISICSKPQSDRGRESPFHRRQRRRIEEQNQKFVNKIISMKCVSSYNKVMKEVSEYERIKELLKGNRSVKLPNLRSLETSVKSRY